MGGNKGKEETTPCKHLQSDGGTIGVAGVHYWLATSSGSTSTPIEFI